MQKPHHVAALSLRCTTALYRSYSTTSHRSADRVSIPTRSNGHLTLDVHHPLTRLSSTPRFILNLPHLPLPSGHGSVADSTRSEGHDAASTLAVSSSAPVVTVNYRLDRERLFPTPIHDVLAAYDWGVKHLTPASTFPRSTRAEGYVRGDDGAEARVPAAKVGVVGRGVGGSLGLMLGLTECKGHERACVAAVSVADAICDWSDLDAVSGTSLASSTTTPKRGSKSSSSKSPQASISSILDTPLLANSPSAAHGLDRRSLLHLRTAFFPTTSPWKCFDPFASPLLFLRTPSKDVPGPRSLEDEFTRLMLAEPVVERDSGKSPDGTQTKERQRRRKVPLKWPPPGSAGLVMPRMRISVPQDRDDDVIAAQGEEMVRLLRRALVRGSVAGRGVGDKFWAMVEEDEEEDDEGGHELARIKVEADRWVELLHDSGGQSRSDESSEEETRSLGTWFDRILR